VKIVRYEQDWRAHWGIVQGDSVSALEGDVFGDARAGPPIGRLDALRLLAPCTPRTIWSNGSNYPSRCQEREHPLPTEPSFLWCPGAMICGPDADIRIPEFEPRSEYGAELGIVLRTDCHAVAESVADAYILGYTALNNVWSKDSPNVASAHPLRVYDTYCPVGPVLDTNFAYQNTSIQLRVDDSVRQDDRTSAMLFSPQRLVSALSQLVPLKRGDLIMTGTPGGIEGQTLQFGQTVSVEIGGLGVLRNRVVRVDNATPTSIVSVKAWLQRPEAHNYVRAAGSSGGGGT
jgi:2-keto-4-pentenoate hydratase/2-oxohepta-3-ene-1,7-dioic acid hydratase in catechol pathway